MTKIVDFKTPYSRVAGTTSDADRFQFVKILGHITDENPELAHIRAMATGARYPDQMGTPYDCLSEHRRDQFKFSGIVDTEGEMLPAYKALAEKIIQPADHSLTSFVLDFSSPDVQSLIRTFNQPPESKGHPPKVSAQVITLGGGTA